MESTVTYGYVEKAMGLKGRMVLKLFVMGPAVPLDEGTVFQAGDRTLTVTRSRKRDNERITLDCKEIWTREQAEELKGETVKLSQSSVLKEGFPLPVYGFAGFTVVSGEKRFQVKDVEFNPVNPQMRVSGDGKEFTIPFNLALSGEVDSENRIITVELPEGLEEL